MAERRRAAIAARTRLRVRTGERPARKNPEHADGRAEELAVFMRGLEILLVNSP